MHPYYLNIPIKPHAKSIDFKDNMLFMGSCFSEHISHKLSHLQFNVFSNTNGVIFNPMSLANPLIKCFNNESYNENDLIENNGNWYSIHHHGKVFNTYKTALLNQINTQQKEFEQKLNTTQWLFITFGSAWIYTLKSNDTIVANCHKIPQSHFEKRLLSIEEITNIWQPILEQLKTKYPTLNIVFTVSPVKHLRDGVHENNLSKGTLLLAIHKLLSNKVSYFPAYELVNDDLRDYRFYEADCAHPNAMAIDYVFDKFKVTYFSPSTNNTCDEVIKYLQLKNHKPISLEGREYEQYLIAKELQLKRVQAFIPWFK
jgi:hypothetical protein